MDVNLNVAKEAIYLRGLIINRFSAIEYAIAEIVFRASLHTDYIKFGQPSFAPDKRRKRLSQFLKENGPISTYKDRIAPIIKKIEDLEEHRHYIAHAIMVPLAKNDIKFRMYHLKKGEPGIYSIDTDIVQMERLADEVGKISTVFPDEISSICDKIPLPIA